MGFFTKDVIKDMRAPCFWEDGRFFDKNMGMRAECFLENGRFFLQNKDMRAVIFS